MCIRDSYLNRVQGEAYVQRLRRLFPPKELPLARLLGVVGISLLDERLARHIRNSKGLSLDPAALVGRLSTDVSGTL